MSVAPVISWDWVCTNLYLQWTSVTVNSFSMVGKVQQQIDIYVFVAQPPVT